MEVVNHRFIVLGKARAVGGLLVASRPLESLAVEHLVAKPLVGKSLAIMPLAGKLLAAKSMASESGEAKLLAAKSMASESGEAKLLAAKPMVSEFGEAKLLAAKPMASESGAVNFIAARSLTVKLAAAKSLTAEPGVKKYVLQKKRMTDREVEKVRDEERVDKFELLPRFEEEESDVIDMFEEDVDAKMKLVTTLKDHVQHWEEMGASKFSLSVIKEGYKMSFEAVEHESEYEEKNNKSYYANKAFANEAVDQLVKVGVLEKVVKCKYEGDGGEEDELDEEEEGEEGDEY